MKLDKGINMKVSNTLKDESMTYTVQPKDREELMRIITAQIQREGLKCNLNFIDTSLIEDMSELFIDSEFNGDISEWDVSNVTNMGGMFYNSKFDGDISNWNTSNVKYMCDMFTSSAFNGGISEWDVSNVTDMNYIFYDSAFNQDISRWDVSSVKYMRGMFTDCPLEVNPQHQPKFK